MTVIFEPDAKDPGKNNPVETTCGVCENLILYRISDLEAQQEEVERRCPVDKQRVTIQVPAELRARVLKRLVEKCPPEILRAATSWQKKKTATTRFMREQRAKDPLYGQAKEYVEKKKGKKEGA